MRVIISDIPEEGLRHDFDLSVGINDDERQETAHAAITIRRLGDRVLCDGTARVAARLVCSRCLKEYGTKFEVVFKEVLLPAPEEGEVEESEESMPDSIYYRNDEIELNDIVREQLLLALPMKPLCSKDCKGLCSRCGTDLNERSCNCRNDGIDPRWKPLEGLKKRLQ